MKYCALIFSFVFCCMMSVQAESMIPDFLKQPEPLKDSGMRQVTVYRLFSNDDFRALQKDFKQVQDIGKPGYYKLTSGLIGDVTGEKRIQREEEVKKEEKSPYIEDLNVMSENVYDLDHTKEVVLFKDGSPVLAPGGVAAILLEFTEDGKVRWVWNSSLPKPHFEEFAFPGPGIIYLITEWEKDWYLVKISNQSEF